MKYWRRLQGFTLIEVMITVAVIGILAAIALPSYSDYVRRGKVQEATSALADMRVKLEQYYQDNRNYGSTADLCGVAVPTSPAVKYFSYSCTWNADGTDQSFIVTANGAASQGMDGYTYTIDQSNAKTSTLPGAASVNCWVTKAGETC